MAKDERLYMKFVNDFHRHPKIARLAPLVRWAFVEMVGEARIADNDGVFEAADAEFMWSRDVLDALLSSHPSRPLVERDRDGRYVIRDYAKHQQTRADREDLSEKRSKAASERWARAKQTDASAEHEHSKVKQPDAESESESELHRPIPTELVGLGSNAREDSTDSEEQAEAAKRLAEGLGVDLDRLITHASKIDRPLSHTQGVRLASIILAKSKRDPKNPDAYIATTFKNDPFEVQKWIDTEVMT